MSRPGSSYWEHEAGIGRRAAAVSPTPRHVDALIAGAGFSGCWLAYFLLQRAPRLSVLIAERDAFGLGASTRNAGFLSCSNVSEWLDDFAHLGHDAALQTLSARVGGIDIVRRELGDEVAIERPGSADFDPVTDDKRNLVEILNDRLEADGHGRPFRFREQRLAGRTVPVTFNALDAQADPVRILVALRRRLRACGARFAWQTRVVDIGNGQARLAGPGGETGVAYRHGFVCTNAFAPDLAPGSTIQPARGQILVTSPTRADTTPTMGFLNAGYDYFRFVGPRLLVGGGRHTQGDRESTRDPTPTLVLADYLRGVARRVLGHDDFHVAHHWAGIMAFPGGRHPSVEVLLDPPRLDAATEVMAGFGGWGVTLAPFVARFRAAALDL